jgi:hypothetical protein
MSTLFSGQSLQPGQSLQSDNQVYTLTMQSDGNVVLYNSLSKPLWQTNTTGSNLREFIMQTDGNLVLYDTSGQPHWNSKTQGHPGAFLNVQDDGNLVVYRAGSTTETANNALWDAGVPPPLNLKTVVASGATLNVGDASLSGITQDLITGVPATDGGVIIPSWDPYPEQGSWSWTAAGPVQCGSNSVTVNASITANWNSGLGWTSSQLQDALAGALQAVMQAFATKTAYQNYSYTEYPTEDGGVVCLDPQPLDQGYYIPPEIQITAYDNGGAQIGQVTATYSTGDQSGETTCDILSALGTVLAIFPPASELAAIVGVGTSLACS